MKTILHVGCGPQNKSTLRGFNNNEWNELRFDIDPNVHPDIIGTLTDMSSVETSSIDAIYSSHNIEHLYAHEIQTALLEFHRVLNNDGIVVITCPDLQSVCEEVSKNRLMETLYTSPAGPISAIDVLYGHRGFIAAGNTYMAHKSGFTYSSLSDSFFQAGFTNVVGGRRPEHFDLWLVAFKKNRPEEELLKIASLYLP